LADSLAPSRWCCRHPRTLGAIVGLPAWAVLATALWLHPDSRGYDTHTQLGLSPCGYILANGVPCPMCGMTTSFAHMVRGRALRALRAQVFGVALFLITVLTALLGTAQAVSGRRCLRILQPRLWWLVFLLAGTAAGWAIKIVVERGG